MKKFLVFLSLFLVFPLFVIADGWDDFAEVDKAWDGQKSITNKEFEDVINALEKNTKQKEEKKRKKQVKKISGGGDSLHSDIGIQSDFKGQVDITKKDEFTLLNIPINLVINEKKLDKGFYNVKVEKDKDNEIYLSFYQSEKLLGKVLAHETSEDYGEENINFVKLIPYDDIYVKIIYGSLDYNAYVFVNYEN